MSRIVYSLVLYIATPLILIRLLLRSLRSPKYRQRIAERFAWKLPHLSSQETGSLIWIHAVSVGEVAAAVPLVNALLADKHRILLTTMTPTGSDRVQLALGDTVTHCYLPYDLPGAINRFLMSVKPSLLLIMETELWPNLIHGCKSQGIPVVLINGRLSEKSARGYERFLGLSKPMLESLQFVAAQSVADGKRFQALGVSESSIAVTGSLKFNISVDVYDDIDDAFFTSVSSSNRPVIIAGSTREGEEVKVLEAFKQVLLKFPQALLLIVPRHPERFNAVAKLCEQNSFEVLRRSQNTALSESVSIVLGDSMGEMIPYYRLADIAFVGGSLVNTGCQNVLEPAALALPVLVGPSQFNFTAICQQLEAAGGLLTVSNPPALAKAIVAWLDNPKEAQTAGLNGFDLLQSNQNALPQVLEVVEQQLRK